MKNKIKIEYLKEGDLVAIAFIAKHITLKMCTFSMHILRSEGFKLFPINKKVLNRSGMFSGKEEDRLMYLQKLLDHPNIKGIFFARGGYGSIKILDQLKFNKFQEKPKWLIGFSDITTILSHVTSLYKIPVIHGKVHQIEHPHQGQAIGGGIHPAQHVHLHLHVCGSHPKRGGRRTGEVAVSDGSAAIVVLFHAHEHVAVGEHESAGAMRVVAHHADRGVTVRAAAGPVAGKITVGRGIAGGAVQWLAVRRMGQEKGSAKERDKDGKFHEICLVGR